LDAIQSGADRAGGCAAGIPFQRVGNLLKAATVLQREAGQDRGVAGEHIEQGIGAIGIEENLANAAVGKITDRQTISRPAPIKGDRYGRTSIGEPIARGHDAHHLSCALGAGGGEATLDVSVN
jgi:hypothetical protein